MEEYEEILDRRILTVDEDSEGMMNIFATSLVANPAIRSNFVVLSEDDSNKFTHKEKDELNDGIDRFLPQGKDGQFKRVVSGVWLKPDTPIVRHTDDGLPYTVEFTKDTLMQIHANFKEGENDKNFTLQHNGKAIEGIKLVESWQIWHFGVMSNVYGNSMDFLNITPENTPLGSLCVSLYIRDEELFEELILSGALKGFSIEGLFKEEQMSKTTEQMFSAIGVEQTEGTLISAEGKLNFTDEQVTLDGKPVTEGEYKLSSGFNVVIRKGQVVDYGFEEVTPKAGESATAVIEAGTESIVESEVTVQPTEVEVVETEVTKEVENDTVDQPIVEVIEETVTPTITPVEEVKEVAEVTPTLEERLLAMETKFASDMASKDQMIADLKEQSLKDKKAHEDVLLAKPIETTPYTPADVNVEEGHYVIMSGMKVYS